MSALAEGQAADKRYQKQFWRPCLPKKSFKTKLDIFVFPPHSLFLTHLPSSSSSPICTSPVHCPLAPPKKKRERSTRSVCLFFFWRSVGPEIGKFDGGQINTNQFADRARGREGISSSISHQKTFKKISRRFRTGPRWRCCNRFLLREVCHRAISAASASVWISRTVAMTSGDPCRSDSRIPGPSSSICEILTLMRYAKKPNF